MDYFDAFREWQLEKEANKIKPYLDNIPHISTEPLLYSAYEKYMTRPTYFEIIDTDEGQLHITTYANGQLSASIIER